MSAEAGPLPPIRYLALGDSLTIGVGASSKKKAFPTLLARLLSKATGRLVDLENPAVDGYAAEDLIRSELASVESFRPDVATVLVGANDIARGSSLGDYRDSLAWIYGALAGVGQVAAIGLPDWSLTPAAAGFGPPEALRQKIEGFNAVAREQAEAAGLVWIDLAPLSRDGSAREGWLAADGLHPGDAQYAAWADAIWAVVGPAWSELADKSES